MAETNNALHYKKKVPALDSLASNLWKHNISTAMQMYLGLAVWGVVAFAIYKVVNIILLRRQLAGK